MVSFIGDRYRSMEYGDKKKSGVRSLVGNMIRSIVIRRCEVVGHWFVICVGVW